MKAVLIRTGSVSSFSGSPKVSISVPDSMAGVFSSEKKSLTSSKVSLRINHKKNEFPSRTIRRALSESDMVRSESEKLMSYPARITEEDHSLEGNVDEGLPFDFKDRVNYAGIFPGGGVPFFGGGFGKDNGGGGVSGKETLTGDEDRSEIGDYYKEKLKSDPGNSLLLRNYGKFLHEVEGDTVKAEEYYGRCILASPGDGEVLALFGKLIWETRRDENRAKSYFEQAVEASPDDCMVLGSYANFMWEAEEDEDEEDMKKDVEIQCATAMVAAF